jgi:alpha-methylacyl-CoA racemase
MSALERFTIIELAGIGPAPMAGMIFADMGATVIRVERFADAGSIPLEKVSLRGKKSIALNLKDPEGLETLLRLVEQADVLIDPYRPGVCEKLGLGPEVCWLRNPKLIFARMTGWGQDGPLSHAAGHDINYIALTGALHSMQGPDRKPTLPLNLIGDMGGGGMLLVSGVLAALLERETSGKGQVVDAAMVDGAAQLMWMFHSLDGTGVWDSNRPGENLLDGGCHFYNTYECADGNFIAIGPVESQFYAELMSLLGLPNDAFGEQSDTTRWKESETQLADIFKRKTRQEWCDLMEGTDACFAPVLSLKEAPDYPANSVRDSYVEIDGFKQPAPAPRFSRSTSAVQHGAHALGQDTAEILEKMSFDQEEIDALITGKVVNG